MSKLRRRVPGARGMEMSGEGVPASMLRRTMLLLTAMALGASACVHAPVRSHLQELLEVEGATFHVHSHSRGDARMVSTALSNAMPQLKRWGGLRRPVVVHVLPDHASLEQAADRPGFGWLRAWARADEVLVQSPSTWFGGGASQAQVSELLLHELTHCVMYQASGPGADWQRKGIPLWFREGMASVTAEQGYRRGTLADLRRFFLRDRDEDLLRDGEERSRTEGLAVYTAAHHAFAHLVATRGEQAVSGILRTMYAGRTFDEAFEQVLGLRRLGFEAEFRQYVLSGDWRRRREKVPQQGP